MPPTGRRLFGEFHESRDGGEVAFSGGFISQSDMRKVALMNDWIAQLKWQRNRLLSKSVMDSPHRNSGRTTRLLLEIIAFRAGNVLLVARTEQEATNLARNAREMAMSLGLECPNIHTLGNFDVCLGGYDAAFIDHSAFEVDAL